MQSTVSRQNLVLRSFQTADIADAHALSSRIGWPQRIEDWQWLAGHAEGYAAMLDGSFVGVTLYWRFGDDVASIGAVMVDDACRGRGIARKLLERCLADLDGRALLLYATEEGKPLYAKSGFTAFETVVQHQGVVYPIGLPQVLPGYVLRPIDVDARDIVVELAEAASGIDRSAMVRSLLDHAQGVLLLRDGQPSGFALFRRYGLGFAVGPVVAEDRETGRTLIQHCLAALPDHFVRIDVPSDPTMSAWLEECGLRRCGSALGMKYGSLPHPHAPLCRVAIATQATG